MAGEEKWYGTAIIFTHSPISGRLRISSITLPIHIDTTMPQNSAGCSVITDGPGWMPWMIIAPIMSAITGFDGMPSVSIGMKDVCEPALLADSGAGHAFDGALAEVRRVLRHLLFQRICGERREHRAAARQDAQHRTEARSAQHRGECQLQVAPGRHEPRDLLHHHAARLLVREVGDDLAQAEDAHRHGHEADAVRELPECRSCSVPSPN
jgi:hypothetical protein